MTMIFFPLLFTANSLVSRTVPYTQYVSSEYWLGEVCVSKGGGKKGRKEGKEEGRKDFTQQTLSLMD